MITTVLSIGAAIAIFTAIIVGPDSAWCRILVVAAVVMFFTGTCVAPKNRGGGTDCYIDWDGRSNPAVCD